MCALKCLLKGFLESTSMIIKWLLYDDCVDFIILIVTMTSIIK